MTINAQRSVEDVNQYEEDGQYSHVEDDDSDECQQCRRLQRQ